MKIHERLDKLAERLGRLEKIANADKFHQLLKDQEERNDKHEALHRSAALEMCTYLDEFERKIEKGEKWVLIAGQFDQTMNDFTKQTKQQLDSIEARTKTVGCMVDDLDMRLKTMVATSAAIQIDERWEAMEKDIREISEKINVIDNKTENLDKMLRNLAIAHVEDKTPSRLRVRSHSQCVPTSNQPPRPHLSLSLEE